MEGKVLVRNCEVDLRVTADMVEWKSSKKKSTKKLSRSVQLEDVINIERVVDKRECFKMNFAATRPKYMLKVKSEVFTCGDETQCEQWMTHIRNIMETLPNRRPRRLLVIINPQAGRRKAQQWYRTKAAPVFEMANIETHIIVTERKRHATDSILEHNLSETDCIVSVGGDGTFRECMSGLVLRTMQDEGLDYNRSDIAVAKPKIKMAALAGGSGNAICYLQYGTLDFETAALHIALGHEGQPIDIGTHFCGNRFLGYGFLISALGFCCDYMYDAEKKRKFQCLGNWRYIFPFMKNMFSRQPMDLEIQYKETERSRKDNTVAPNNNSPETISETFVDILIFARGFQMEDDRLSANPHKDNMFLVRPCSAKQHFQVFPRLVGKNSEREVEYMSQMSVDEVNVMIKGGGRKRENDMYVVNIDGEISALPEPKLHVRYHRDVICCYGTSIQDSEGDAPH